MVEQMRRHDAVVDTISRVPRQVGAQVRTEVRGLDASSRKRPNLPCWLDTLGRQWLVSDKRSTLALRARVGVRVARTEERRNEAGARLELGPAGVLWGVVMPRLQPELCEVSLVGSL